MNAFFRLSGSHSWKRRWFLWIALCLAAGRLIAADEKPAETKVLHTFSMKQKDGSNPQGTLLEGSDGALYGTTTAGGADRYGTIFKLNKDGTGYQLLHSFRATGNDGRGPESGVIEGQDGFLYGTAEGGGTAGAGTVFKIGKDGKDYVVEGKDGTFYGTTLGGGPQSCGLVFRLSRDGREYKTLFAFTRTGPEGRSPYGGLTRASDGTLYGATCGGTAESLGAVFCLKVLSRP